MNKASRKVEGLGASTRLSVRLMPSASRAGVVGRQGEAWKIRVAAPPENGRANDALVSLLADTLGLARRDVSVVAGQRTRNKVVALEGISASELDRRLVIAAGAGS
jgi:uncharacterized protein (TIGR00251 family)